MSNDVTTMYTKEQNKIDGRNGYLMAHKEKVTRITPKEYGMFISKRRKERK